MRLIPLQSAEDINIWAANYIAKKINDFSPSATRFFVLGLPTGETPLATYQHLIALHKAGQLSFKYVVTFNMDEYVGLGAAHVESYHHYMHTHFFNHIDIPTENINLLNGLADDIENECQRYEEKLKCIGKVNLFLGGVGKDGHIAFNEPGSSLTSRTRMKTLSPDTRIANARYFNNEINRVPKFALTVGVGTLLDATEILILISGENKALALKSVIEGSINHLWTISALQLHPKVIIACDAASTMELKVKTLKYFAELELNQPR